MKTVGILIKRNIKLYFKDRGMFFTSLITPMILLVLYATFLGNVYWDSFVSGLPEGMSVPGDVIEGLVAGQLISSLLAVSCITVAFCSNFLMVQDRANGSIKDLMISPVASSKLSVSYYIATLSSTFIISLAAMALCLVYAFTTAWYMSAADVLFLLADIALLVLFGTALSSVINFFLSTQGQISAVGSIVSAGYGFICGAYMPVSSFGNGMQKLVSFLPGTYGTSLVRNHALRGVLDEMESIGIPRDAIDSFRDTLDCNVYFFGKSVSISAMFIILAASAVLLAAVYILLNKFKKKI
ncbi:MAG: ABC transporter permease [Clostridia bacterium]|nr:ABC transporter permease [Clostridia bacterium]